MSRPDRQMTIWFLATTGLLLGLVILFNYLLDPAHLFEGGKYESEVADLLIQEQNVANLANYDERLLQKKVIEGFAHSKDVVVLGSSRSMQLRSGSFPGQTFFNNAVSGSTLEDMLAIYGVYQGKGMEPESVVLGIDPWMFNRNHGQTRWRVLADDYNRLLDVLQVPTEQATPNSDLDKMKQLVSYDYTKSSLNKLRTGDFRGFYPTELEVADDFIKHKDGSIVYDRELRTRPLEVVNQSAEKASNTHPLYLLGAFTELDAKEQEKFEAFVSYLQARKTGVTIFLPPYHPILYQTIATSDQYQMVLQLEQYLRDVAKQHNITVIGSYDPAASGATDQDFYDEMHPKSELVQRLFAH